MLLANALAPRADSSWGPMDDRWYLPNLGLESDAGVTVTAETAWRCVPVLAALRFKAESFGACPPHVYRELPGDRRERDRTHYLHNLLRHPNEWQTGFRWRSQQMAWLNTWGNSYSRIVPGRDSFVAELRPLPPSQVKVLDQLGDGSLVYEYRPFKAGEPAERIPHSAMLHLRGLSMDGYTGAPIYNLIRNLVGIALAAEKHVSTFLRKGVRLAGVMSGPGGNNLESRKAFTESWTAAFGGADAVGSVALVGSDHKFMQLSLDHEKAQFLQLQYFDVEMALMALGVPGVVVGYQGDKASTYASADVFYEKGGIRHCLQPTVQNVEEEIDHALLERSGQHYVKFNMDALLRASTAARYSAHVQAVGGPFRTVNEARRDEDLNPVDDPAADEVMRPSNMTGGDAPAGPAPEPMPGPSRRPAPPPRQRPEAPPAEDDEEAARAADQRWRFAYAAAARVVRREIAALRDGRTAAKYARDPAAWRAWVAGYYERHVAHVAEAMLMDELKARAYAEGQRDALLEGGLSVAETWEEAVPWRLATLALGEL